MDAALGPTFIAVLVLDVNMDTDETEENRPAEIPDDAIIIRQSSWAWLWAVVPWAIFAAASLYFDFTFVGLPLILAVVIVVPRYLSSRKTAYILTDEHVVVLRGTFAGNQRYDLPISQISDVRVHPGFFGRTLGYTAVYLTVREGGVAVLHHVPYHSPLVEHVRARIDPSAPPEHGAGG